MPGLSRRANVSSAIRHEWSPTDSTWCAGRYRSHPLLFTLLISPIDWANFSRSIKLTILSEFP